MKKPLLTLRARAARAVAVVAIAALAPAVLAAATLRAQAAERAPDPIETDRPDFIESSVVVPRGFWQLENGLLAARQGGVTALHGTETLLRVSLADRFEWRLGLPNLEWEQGPGALGAGLADGYAGIKWQVGPIDGWELAVIPGTSLPFGAAGRTSGSWDPELKLTFAHDLPSSFDVSGMLAVFWPTAGGARVTNLQPALSVAREVAPRVRVFIEWVGAFNAGQDAGHLAHAGVAWRVGEHVQFDVHAGHGLVGDFPDGFVAMGFSFRRGPRPATVNPGAP